MHYPTRNRIFCLLFAGLISLAVHGQADQLSFERLTWNEGVAGNVVLSIAQDDLGFMWFATPSSGLLRYDGYTFTCYTHDPDTPGSLANDNVQYVYNDNQGVLWAATFGGGLDRYHPESDSFIHHRRDPEDSSSIGSNSVQTILEDELGNFWVGTFGAGLNKLDRTTGAFTHYLFGSENPDDANSLSHEDLNVILEGNDGTLWLGTEGGGLNHFNPETEAFTSFRNDPADTGSLATNDVTSLYQDKHDNLWVGTTRNVIHRLKDGSNSFERFYYNQWIGEASKGAAPVSGSISFIGETEDGKLLITGGNCCSERFEVREDVLIPDYLPGTLRFATHRTSFQSRDGVLWQGTMEGIFRINPTPAEVTFHRVESTKYSQPVVMSLLQDDNGVVWVGTDEGLLRKNSVTGNEIWATWDNHRSSMSVWSILRDSRGRYWVGANDGLYRLDPKTNHLVPESGVPANRVGYVGLTEDLQGNIWASEFGVGVRRLDAISGGWELYSPDPDDPKSITGNYVQEIMMARDGVIWLGLSGGLNRYDAASNSFTGFTPTADDRANGVAWDVHAMFEDQLGFIWYGTPHNTGGITRFDPRNGRFEHMTEEDHLAYGFQDDGSGDVWIETESRLLRYNQDEGSFTSFGSEDGFEWWKVGAVTLPFVKDDTGRILMGMAGGYYDFRIDQLSNRPVSAAAQLVFSGLSINGDDVEHGSSSAISGPIWLVDDIKLAYDENSPELTFAALDYTDSEVSYRFKLEDHDESWRMAGPDRIASYSKLPAGQYRFLVQASIDGSDWGFSQNSVALIVAPPWWRSTVAYIFYGLFLIIGVITVDRTQRKRIVRKEREATRDRELEQAKEIESAYTQLKRSKEQLVQQEKLASLGSLTAGIAHEIKNPLNFVNNFAEVSVEMMEELGEAVAAGKTEEAQSIISEMTENASQIAKHGKRADSIVRSMMQHARGGTSVHENVNVADFLEEHINLAWHGRRAKDQSFQADVIRDFAEDVGEARVQPMEMGRVILNLLNNAFDAVSGTDGGAVTVRAVREANGVQISVSDNGPGIPEDIHEKIFEPFFTTKETGEGTGLGLSLSHDIVTKGHGGKLTVQDANGGGAKFVIQIPDGKA